MHNKDYQRLLFRMSIFSKPKIFSPVCITHFIQNIVLNTDHRLVHMAAKTI